MRNRTSIQGIIVFLAIALCAVTASAAGPPYSCTNITAAPALPVAGTILKMSAGTNAHGALPADTVYVNRIVCSMEPAFFTSSFNCEARAACLANETSMLRLSSPTNAHASGSAIGGYSQQICCNVVTIGLSKIIAPECSLVSPSIPGTNAACPEGTRQIVRLSSPTNAHLSNNSYPYAVCCDFPTECNDGIDNDGDGYIDWNGAAGIRADPGCMDNQYHITERCGGDLNCPQCDNGEDDDLDGTTDYPEDKGCQSPVDDDEFDQTIEVPYCQPDCSYQIDNICHKECIGRPEEGPERCVAFINECDGRPVGSIITQADGSLRACCGGLIMPALNAATMTYNSKRDRVRSTRIVKASTGDSLSMIVVSFG